MRVLICFILALSVLIRCSFCAVCNVCNAANSLACYSSTQMQACTNNLPSALPFACPTGYVCTSTTAGVLCQLNGAGVIAACDECNTCDATKTFACTGTGTFALCLNSATPSSIVGTCAAGLICNIANPFICGDQTATSTPSCSYADNPVPTTTSASAITSTLPTAVPLPMPSTYCAAMQQSGRFPYGSNPSSTCRQYIDCHLLGGIWRGSLYRCPGTLYFDSSSRTCTVALPARCTAAVASLSLFDMDLF